MFEESWQSPAIALSAATGFSKKRLGGKRLKMSSNANAVSCTINQTGGSNSTSTIPNTRIQCPVCLRLLSVRDFGQCIGVPTAEFPLLKTQDGMNTRKRKRTETRSAHETMVAPCNECLDSLGETEGATWGRCDNPRCWSRRGGSSSMTGGSVMGMNMDGEYSENQGVIQADELRHLSGNHHQSLPGLVCPKCTPEGASFGMGMPGCLNDYCDECDEFVSDEERCMECGKRELCGACRNGLRSPTYSSSSDGSSDSKSEEFSHRVFSWRCRLCSLPVCGGCVPSASMNKGINMCRNCHSDLCGACRSILACERCGEEMCQLCLGESLVMLCDKCEHGLQVYNA
ncbi:hypothetical protein BT96DRAFT_925932 [Gymnopus androsaceus JB14]|uniref:Uncharacterized protein n=1 Tax=Gymnopus androsaceus JB14 TaxID=1447944 RepID=A0A6A4GY41_9AGAR|nr:hypothetical protein BT96DRAFT_925932 [Gymnopus androsaceus JB14]